MSVMENDFNRWMASLGTLSSVAVGVSGGPDSMALCHLLSHWAAKHDVQVHAITVDHGLRAEAADEAKQVGEIVKNWPHLHHVTLRWEGDKPESRILEEARTARYALMKNYVRDHGLKHLFIAHHQDDQAETFLIRLAKGSGLDGLAGMQPVAVQQDGVILCRPLLDVSKAELVAYCEANEIPFVRDPTNENDHYLRPRLRASRAALEEEGLSSKRLAVTASRLARARRALETLSDDLFTRAVKEQNEDEIIFDWNAVKVAPEELAFRVLGRAIDELHPGDDYGPRTERLEQLLSRLLHEDGFKGATLGGCQFSLSAKHGTLTVAREHS